MVASTPRASGPQAVVCALWAASVSPDAVALAQFWPVPNATHTSHSTFCADTVVHARKATKARIARTVRNLRVIGPVVPLSSCRNPLCWAIVLSMLATRGIVRRLSAFVMVTFLLAIATPPSACAACSREPPHHAHHGGAGHSPESNNGAPSPSGGCPHSPSAECAVQSGCAAPVGGLVSEPIPPTVPSGPTALPEFN